jgi:hypothetical protein
VLIFVISFLPGTYERLLFSIYSWPDLRGWPEFGFPYRPESDGHLPPEV